MNSNVNLPLTQGVCTLLLQARKTLHAYICFATNSEPEELQTSSIGSNKLVTITLMLAKEYPIFSYGMVVALDLDAFYADSTRHAAAET